MKNKIIIVMVFIAVAILMAVFLHAPEDYKEEIYATRVVDGDTIELSNGEKVRYIGIDTPELRVKDNSTWVYNPMPYAELAKDANRNLVEGKEVKLEFDVQKRDRYNRLLAYVYAGDIMINLELLTQGYAMIYTYPPNLKHVEKFLDAQREARENKRGLWSELEKNAISSSEARENIGIIRKVETQVLDTYLSERVLILNCRDGFKVAIFRDNLLYFPKMALRLPDSYFKHKIIRVYGIIKDYRGSPEIIAHHPSQIEIVE